MVGRGPSTEWDTVLSSQEAMEKAAQLMREQSPQRDARLLAFTLRVTKNTDLMFMSDIKAMANHFGFTAESWSRFCEEYAVIRFQRKSP